jgi:hypothetical protein
VGDLVFGFAQLQYRRSRVNPSQRTANTGFDPKHRSERLSHLCDEHRFELIITFSYKDYEGPLGANKKFQYKGQEVESAILLGGLCLISQVLQCGLGFSLTNYLLSPYDLLRSRRDEDDVGTVLSDKGHAGKVWVYHFFVVDYGREALWGYDLFLRSIPRERDHLVDKELIKALAELWSRALVDPTQDALAREFYRRVLSKRDMNVLEARAVRHLSKAAMERLYRFWCEQNPDAMPICASEINDTRRQYAGRCVVLRDWVHKAMCEAKVIESWSDFLERGARCLAERPDEDASWLKVIRQVCNVRVVESDALLLYAWVDDQTAAREEGSGEDGAGEVRLLSSGSLCLCTERILCFVSLRRASRTHSPTPPTP